MNFAKLFHLKTPTATARRRGFCPIRYRSPDEVCHGIIVEELPKGALRVWLVGDERARILKAADVSYVTRLDAAYYANVEEIREANRQRLLDEAGR